MYDEPTAGMATETAPDERLLMEMQRNLKEAEEMASHFRKQSEVMRHQAEQCEAVVKACGAAINVLRPQEQAKAVAFPCP